MMFYTGSSTEILIFNYYKLNEDSGRYNLIYLVRRHITISISFTFQEQKLVTQCQQKTYRTVSIPIQHFYKLKNKIMATLSREAAIEQLHLGLREYLGDITTLECPV